MTPERRAYVLALLRATARVLASDDPNMRVVTSVWVTRLDAQGRPTGETVDLGPVAMSFPLHVSLAP